MARGLERCFHPRGANAVSDARQKWHGKSRDRFLMLI
jgi:hypothetical protein